MNITIKNKTIEAKDRIEIYSEFSSKKIKDTTGANLRMLFALKFPDLAANSVEVCEVYDLVKSLGYDCVVERDVNDVNGIIIS